MSPFFLFLTLLPLPCYTAAPANPLPMIPGIWDMMQRQPAGEDKEMERLTLAPIIKINLAKTILQDSPVVPNLVEALDNIVAKVATKGSGKKISFLQANPHYLRNSGDVTMPLRRPPQAYVNIAVRENVVGSQSANLIFQQKKETEKLRNKNNELMMTMLKKANITRS